MASPMMNITYCLRRALKYLSVPGRELDSVGCRTFLFPRHGRLYSASSKEKHSVAIIGSGPAGYYTAQQLLKGNNEVVVDIYEKLPVPFGLVRFGVAPDHPEVKNVIHTFTETARKSRCHFVGNVEVGKDVSLQKLREVYSAVALCYGAADDRTLGIPGEDLPNTFSARSFVGWYNGIPEDVDLPVNLDCESAVVLGHGNVALDLARILLSPINVLEKTDICDHALETLLTSKVRQVFLVGRRGPLQVNFTIKELREMTKLPGVKTLIDPKDVEGLDKIIKDLPRPRRRLIELIHKTSVASAQPGSPSCARECHVVFQRSPVRILNNDQGVTSGLEFAVNELQGDSIENKKAVPTDEREVIPCGLVLKSVGYRVLPIDSSVPFDEKRGVIDNTLSRVTGETGLYCSGWASVGPVVATSGTMTYAFETGKAVLHDMDKGLLETKGLEGRDSLLRQLGDKAVSFAEWEKIDFAEMSAGERLGKPREKVVSVKEMLRLAKS